MYLMKKRMSEVIATFQPAKARSGYGLQTASMNIRTDNEQPANDLHPNLTTVPFNSTSGGSQSKGLTTLNRGAAKMNTS